MEGDGTITHDSSGVSRRNYEPFREKCEVIFDGLSSPCFCTVFVRGTRNKRRNETNGFYRSNRTYRTRE